MKKTINFNKTDVEIGENMSFNFNSKTEVGDLLIKIKRVNDMYNCEIYSNYKNIKSDYEYGCFSLLKVIAWAIRRINYHFLFKNEYEFVKEAINFFYENKGDFINSFDITECTKFYYDKNIIRYFVECAEELDLDKQHSNYALAKQIIRNDKQYVTKQYGDFYIDIAYSKYKNKYGFAIFLNNHKVVDFIVDDCNYNSVDEAEKAGIKYIKENFAF